MEDSYYSSLKSEFNYLSHLHQLPSLSIHEWKFMWMRPHNFPTFRLAQFAGLLSRRIKWFEFIKQTSLEELTDDLRNIAASSFWNEHFHFGKTAKSHNAVLTPDFIQHLKQNAFLRLLFCYGEYIGDISLKL